MRNINIQERGSVLIVLIITMVIMATLGTSMYLLTTTSTFGSLFSNKANRALLLAESGIRYAQKGNTASTTYNLNGGVDSIVIAYDSATGNITSTGIADANGTWPVRRKLTYVAGSSGGGGTPEGPPTAVPMTAVAGGPGNSTGTFTPGDYYGNPGALKVTGVKGDVDNPQSYPEAYGAPTWTTNPFCQPWSTAGNFLSYDLQLKVSEEHNTAPAWWQAGTTYYFDDLVRATLSGNVYDLICQQTTCQALPVRYWWGWDYNGWSNVVFVYNLGGLFRMNGINPQTTAYGLTFFRSTRLDSMSGAPLDGVDATMMPTNLNDNEPAILLFTRDGGANTGSQNTWLAYMTLSGSNFVVDDEDFLKRWNTLLVRVVEAASIKLSATTAPNIDVGDQVAGGTGSATIVKKINDSSDGRVVLLLNNVSGSFTSPVTVSGTSYTAYNGWGDAPSVPSWQNNTLYRVGDWVRYSNTNYRCIQEHTSNSSSNRPDRQGGAAYWQQDTPPSFYRPRDNYIWAFFADTDNHTAYNATATDNTRREKDLFPADLTNFSPPFPLTDIQSWDAANDDFTLVTWNSSLNTGHDSSLRRMGTGKEQNAIIRTNKWVTGSYPTNCSSFPPEIGIVAKGTVSMQFAYDDLAYRILWGAGGGGTSPSAGYYSY
jgi:chitodextrinase